MIEAENSETKSSNLPSENDKTNQNHESQEILPLEETPAPKIIQTLPDSLNSMIGESIEIETNDAQKIIEMLGKKLGINDYQTNLATFWLLDTMAFEVIRMKGKMSPINLGIVISWIAGEAKLIQEKKFSRGEFFKEMEFMFANMFDQLGKGKSLMYWEEATGNSSQLTEHVKSEEDEQEDAISRPSSNHGIKVAEEFVEYEEVEVVTVPHDNYSSNLNEMSEKVLESAMEVLEAIMESTYAIFGSTFHYATVYAALAQPIEIHVCQLPYTLRFPRPVQRSSSKSTIPLPDEGDHVKTRSKIEKEKSDKNKAGKVKVKTKSPTAILPTPLPLTDEEMMLQKRKQILPLMESNEAPHLLGQFSQQHNLSLLTETAGLDKKTKRKTKRI